VATEEAQQHLQAAAAAALQCSFTAAVGIQTHAALSLLETVEMAATALSLLLTLRKENQ
jgi:hypothetical protein